MDDRPTPLGAVARGLVAGAVGTGVMTLAQQLSAKLRSSGEDQDQGSGQPEEQEDPWEQAPVPAKLARRVSEGVLHKEVPPERIGVLTNVMHWGYGTTWGAVYGLLQGTLHGPVLRQGLAFGGAVWAMSYAQLVPAGLYEPPWEYPLADTATEIGFHLAYGVGVATAYRALGGR